MAWEVCEDVFVGNVAVDEVRVDPGVVDEDVVDEALVNDVTVDAAPNSLLDDVVVISDVVVVVGSLGDEPLSHT